MRLSFPGRSRNPDDSDVASVLTNLHRLEEVKSSGLTERRENPELNALTNAAARELSAQSAMVTIVGDEHQYFAGAFGLTGQNEAERRSDVDRSYCKYVVTLDDVLAIENSETDPLVADNKGTTEDNVRSYLGVPMRRNGQVIGSFCVMNNEPRTWTVKDLDALEGLAEQAMQHINETPQ